MKIKMKIKECKDPINYTPEELMELCKRACDDKELIRALKALAKM